MASSRKSKRNRVGSTNLTAHVAARLKGVVQPGDRVVLGLSGGVDSIVLLDVLGRLTSRLRFELQALHVNHQISANAAGWARACVKACRERGIACRVVKVKVDAGASLERGAREARYAALSRARAEYIALAHNKDDQAETILLQLFRGAGVRGLAGMPAVRPHKSAQKIIRPLLDVTRAEIERYARRRKLEWVEDESNADPRYTRNWLRHEVLPKVAVRIPAYREILARAAQNFGEAAALLDELAFIDAGLAVQDEGIGIDALHKLSVSRAKNLLRFLIASRGYAMPDAERLSEGLRQALGARGDAKVSVDFGACVLRRHRGFIRLVPSQAPLVAGRNVTWLGQREIALPQLGGVLRMTRGQGAGLSVARLASETVTVRARQGGERLQPDPKRPRRTVKNLLQEVRMPAWERERLPFIYCGEALACVPGVAIDYRFRAQGGEDSILPVWVAS